MKTMIRGKWLIILGWVIVITALVLTAPNMSRLVREKGQITVPDGYSSSRADAILADMHKKDGTGASSQVALVFHSNHKLTQTDINSIKHGVDELNHQKDSLGITSIMSSFNDASLKDKLVSKDGKTILTAVEVNKGNRTPKELSSSLYQVIDDVKVPHYYTSGWMVNEDLVTSSQEGLHKTEWLTVVFILAVLIIVFRSAIAPIIPLVTVGITYITAQSIVAFLVDKFNFPLSTFTQIFLVAVLFGIGTDYCILLLSRFKEELSHRESVIEAILITYRNAGRTVFFSALAVMIGFSAIGLSTFKLYQSGAAVAVGIAVLLIALFTIVPIFMAVLGTRLFWPAIGQLEHKQSRFWGFTGRLVFHRPLLTLLFVAMVAVPFLITYKGYLSFNSLDEIGNSYNSVKGFNIIANSFGPGESMPTKLVFKNDVRMDSPKYLSLIEKITREVSKIKDVKSVRSATQPTGDKMNDFLVPYQATQLNQGLGQSKDGLNKISKGLADAATSLKASSPKLNKATHGMGSLVQSTQALSSGMNQLGNNLQKLEQGLRDGSTGLNQIKQAVSQSRDSAQTLANQSQQLLNGYKKMAQGLGALDQQYVSIQNGLNKGLTTVESSLQHLAKNYPQLQNDKNYQTAYGATLQMLDGNGHQPSPIDGFQQLNNQMSQLKMTFDQANLGFSKLISGQQQLTTGLNQLVDSLGQLEKGINQVANGQQKIVNNIPAFTKGLTGISQGQEQLKTGFSQLNDQLSQLTNGLNSSVNGINKVADGLSSVQDYLTGLSEATNQQLAGWYLPEKTLKNKDFQKSLDTYMSKDRKITTMDVIFNTNPYETKTLDKINLIKSAVKRATNGTALENAKFGISGMTSTYSDLRQISKADYTRTVIIMLIGIALILMGLLRSFIMPVYIIASLVLTYFTAMGIAEVIFVHILGYSGISWSIPFFAFVMLVALGVDYSIFLMDRFNEYRGLPVEQAMILAMKNMGTVIISAVIILGGTFAAMLPAGVLSLMEIATIILAGLVLYAFVFLPFFVPLMVRTFGTANWWPFSHMNDSSVKK